jgi:hypothetical protein
MGLDFVLAGAALGFVGSIMMAKSFLGGPFQRQITQTYLGQNPYLVRNQIVQRVEAFVGTIWLAASFLCGSLGAVISATESTAIDRSQYWLHFAAIILMAASILWLSVLYTKQKSRNEYIPMMLYLLRGSYQHNVKLLSTGGLEDNELHRIDIAQDIKEKRLMDVSRKLDDIGNLVEISRQPREIDRDYAKRLKALFDPDT